MLFSSFLHVWNCCLRSWLTGATCPLRSEASKMCTKSLDLQITRRNQSSLPHTNSERSASSYTRSAWRSLSSWWETCRCSVGLLPRRHNPISGETSNIFSGKSYYPGACEVEKKWRSSVTFLKPLIMNVWDGKAYESRLYQQGSNVAVGNWGSPQANAEFSLKNLRAPSMSFSVQFP